VTKEELNIQLDIAGIALLKVQKLAREQENQEMTEIVRWWVKESKGLEE
tara:strand:+ start:724 stop:870 length:147 start_codon:yes stop_codon:yes gene_type:complete